MPQPSQPPTLSEFGLIPPAYIRKINRLSDWQLDSLISQEEVDRAIDNIFNSEDDIYSIWRVDSNFDFYCVAVSLNADRDSPHEQINFIWITDDDLAQMGLQATQVDEGKCVHAKRLHFDVRIKPSQAQELCSLLIRRNRSSYRCTKGQMKLIVKNQEEHGCKVYKNHPKNCACEKG